MTKTLVLRELDSRIYIFLVHLAKGNEFCALNTDINNKDHELAILWPHYFGIVIVS